MVIYILKIVLVVILKGLIFFIFYYFILYSVKGKNMLWLKVVVLDDRLM